MNKPPSDDTDAFRLYDSAGVSVDAFAGHWLVRTRDAGAPSWLKTANGWKSIWRQELDTENKQPPELLAGEAPNGPFEAREHGVTYEVSFESGYSQGIFLDQRLNRRLVRERVAVDDRVLNTFSYSCAFSVAAALGGATTTSVDLSKNYLEWGKRNFALNDVETDAHYFTRGDAFDWLRRWAKSGVRFDGVVLDPPTFSRNAKGKVFRVEKDFSELVELGRSVVNPGGWMLCSTNYRGMTGPYFRGLVRAAAGRGAQVDLREMPPEFGADDYLKTAWVEC